MKRRLLALTALAALCAACAVAPAPAPSASGTPAAAAATPTAAPSSAYGLPLAVDAVAECYPTTVRRFAVTAGGVLTYTPGLPGNPEPPAPAHQSQTRALTAAEQEALGTLLRTLDLPALAAGAKPWPADRGQTADCQTSLTFRPQIAGQAQAFPTDRSKDHGEAYLAATTTLLERLRDLAAVAPDAGTPPALSGLWVEAPATSPARLTLTECNGAMDGYAFTHLADGTVTGTSQHRLGPTQGQEAETVTDSVDGTLRGDALALTGTRTTYSNTDAEAPPRSAAIALDLTYDRATGHLTGTKDGRAIALVRATYAPACGQRD